MAMNPFLKDHALSLFGSAVLHVLIGAAALALAWWTVAPKLIPPAAIEAYVAAPRPASRPAAPTPAPPAPPTAEPAPTSTAPVVVPDPLVHERALAEARARHEEEVRAANVKREAEAAAARRSAEAEAAAREAKQRAAAAAEAQRRADEIKHKAEAAAEAQRRADAAQLSAKESDLARQLAAEEHRAGAEQSGQLAQYVSLIQARIERAWNRPPTAKPGLSCTVFVSQVPGGTVTNVKLGDCNGDAAVQQSITLAVMNASPLPAPPDPSLFERNLRLVFAPQ
jgi:type IV secretory pathway VirB10-like protein